MSLQESNPELLQQLLKNLKIKVSAGDKHLGSYSVTVSDVTQKAVENFSAENEDLRLELISSDGGEAELSIETVPKKLPPKE